MDFRILTLGAALAVSVSHASEAQAQVAAEEAVVVSGTSAGTGRASRGLRNAVRGSINGATAQIRSIPRGTPRRSTPRSRAAPANAGALPADSDPLENTDAPAYQLSNGATLRVSGGMRNSAAARCTQNCTGGRRASVISVGRAPASSPEPRPEAKPEAKAPEKTQPKSEVAQPD